MDSFLNITIILQTEYVRECNVLIGIWSCRHLEHQSLQLPYIPELFLFLKPKTLLTFSGVFLFKEGFNHRFYLSDYGLHSHSPQVCPICCCCFALVICLRLILSIVSWLSVASAFSYKLRDW